MHPVSHATSIHHVCVIEDLGQLQGCQPGRPILRLPAHDTILAQHRLETSALPLAFCHSIPRLLNIKIFLSEKATFPAGQQLRKKGACQVMSAQTNSGWLSLHACRVHPGVFQEKNLRRGENGNLFFFENSFFSPCNNICKNQVSAYTT